MLFKNKQNWHLSNTMADEVKQVLKPEILLSLNKCHHYCTLLLKSLIARLTPSSAICPNERLLSELSRAITPASPPCSDSGNDGSFLLYKSPPLSFVPGQTHDSAKWTPRCSSRAKALKATRVSRQQSAWRHAFAVYLRRPLHLLSACASSGGYFCAIHTDGRSGGC